LFDNNSEWGSGVFGAASRRPSRSSELRPLRGISRRFGDLRVWPKFMVLHNLFFIVLTCAVYFSLIPLVEKRLAMARSREVSLIVRTFQAQGQQDVSQELAEYDLRHGSATELQIPEAAREWLYEHPGQVWRREAESDFLYRWQPATGPFYRLRLPLSFYDEVLESIKILVFAVLGLVYVLAVLMLELMILPKYVYQPLRLLLAAEEASLRGDLKGEIIDESFIPGDEIGKIMRSQNEMIRELRRREEDLAQTLQRLEDAKRNLESQDRLVSLGLLSASVAHEMNTPLAVLHGSIEKLLETVDSPATQSRLQRMIRVTLRLRKISEALLDFARARRQSMEPVELKPLVDEAWGFVAIDEKSPDVAFENRVPEGCAVVGNSDRLAQVFVNLLRNSLQAAPCRNGRITVQARATRMDSRPAVAITVEDNGPGISDEILPEVFEAFVTTRLDSHGTGLGLTVAEGIVTQHGGSITATNRSGGGAKLEILLPAAVTPVTT